MDGLNRFKMDLKSFISVMGWPIQHNGLVQSWVIIMKIMNWSRTEPKHTIHVSGLFEL